MIASDLNTELLFPIEIMFEIFSWLTVASLLRCKSVCKRWNQIIQHPKFIEMHMMREIESILFYISLDGTAETFTMVACCRGLLVEKSKVSCMYRIRNPATRQILALPYLQEETVMFMAIFYLQYSDSYKLVNTYFSANKIEKWGCRVLSLGGNDLSWRALEDSNLQQLDVRRQKIYLLKESAFLYCTGLSIDGSSNSQMLCLNVETEIFTGSFPVSVPNSFLLDWENVLSMKWYMKAAFCSIVDQELHVWLLENLIQPKWEEKKIIIPLTFLKDNPDMKETLIPYSATADLVWFHKDGLQSIGYYPKLKKLLKSQTAPPGKKIRCCLYFTLVTLKGMQPEDIHTDEVAGSTDYVIWTS